MMAPPRFQCFSVARQVTKNGLNIRAAFSTSQVSRSDESPKRSSTADLLDLFPGVTTSSTPSEPRSQPTYQNPIQFQKQASPDLQTGTSSANQRIYGLISRSQALRERQNAQQSRSSDTIDEYKNRNAAADLSKQISRRWRAGDIYAPHDLSEVEMAKWKRRGKPQADVFDVLDLNPVEHYRNFSIMSEYITPMGRIKHSKETGLRPVNQRRIARAIRRTIGMGMMPSVHRHPEILYKQATRSEQNSPFKAVQGVS